MADKHPYLPSSGYIVQVLNHFRKSLPQKVNADTLKKLGFAPKNESYVLNILRFLNLIDAEGNKTDAAAKLFTIHDDSQFQQEFSKGIHRAYKELFDLHGDESWSLPTDSLITFFRSSDQSTALVGKLQASTFQVLAAFAGHGELPETRKRGHKSTPAQPQKAGKKTTKPAKGNPPATQLQESQLGRRPKDVGLTVRIEINLPADGDQDTYDRIFKSIRQYLLNE